jgi:hypothetical protein
MLYQDYISKYRKKLYRDLNRICRICFCNHFGGKNEFGRCVFHPPYLVSELKNNHHRDWTPEDIPIPDSSKISSYFQVTTAPHFGKLICLSSSF